MKDRRVIGQEMCSLLSYPRKEKPMAMEVGM